MITNEMKVDIFYLYSKAKMWVTRYSPREFTVREMLPEIEEQVSDFEGKHLGKYQLILTPLSEITDEDAIQVACLCERHNSLFKEADWPFCGHAIINYHFFGKMIWQQHEEYKNAANIIGTVINCFQEHPERVILLTDFLRSKSYALPYMGVDLFESGIAIPNNKTK